MWCYINVYTQCYNDMCKMANIQHLKLVLSQDAIHSHTCVRARAHTHTNKRVKLIIQMMRMKMMMLIVLTELFSCQGCLYAPHAPGIQCKRYLTDRSPSCKGSEHTYQPDADMLSYCHIYPAIQTSHKATTDLAQDKLLKHQDRYLQKPVGLTLY